MRLFIICTTIFCASVSAQVEEVYSVFGKLYLTGYLEYELLSIYDYITDEHELLLNRNDFGFENYFLDGIRAVLVIEETEGRTRSVLRLGDVPTEYNSFVLNRNELDGVRWSLERSRFHSDLLLIPDLETEHIGFAGELRWQNPSWLISLCDADAVVSVKNDTLKPPRKSAVTGLEIRRDFNNNGIGFIGAWDRRNDAEACIIDGYQLLGSLLVKMNVFRVSADYDASATVSDNDDKDHIEDWNERPEDVIPMVLDRNNNGIVDYDDDFLMWEVDDDFLRGRDWNNNGIRDIEENDNLPDYPYPVDRQGFETSIGLESGTGADNRYNSLSFWADSLLVGNGRQWAIMLESSWEKQLTSGRLDLFTQIKRVSDSIEEELVFFSFPTPSPSIPPLFPDDIFASFSGVVDYTGIVNTFLSAGVKAEASWRMPRGVRRLYQAGVIRGGHNIPLRRDLQLNPMLKFKIRHGFAFRTRSEIFSIQELALVKLVYLFSRSTTITAGVQFLAEQDKSGMSQSFTRTTLQIELDRTFIAYSRQMFLHIGLTSVFQNGDLEENDRRERTAFVRVYTEF